MSDLELSANESVSWNWYAANVLQSAAHLINPLGGDLPERARLIRGFVEFAGVVADEMIVERRKRHMAGSRDRF